MSAPTDIQRPNYRDEAKLYYRSKKNIEAKWLDQYGNMSRDNDYQRNRACMGEVFNMLDVVMDICIEDFRRSHSIIAIDMIGRTPVYTFALQNGDPAGDSPDKDSVTFSMPTTFNRRVRTLRSIGYPLSDELLYDTRLLRNETTHGNRTIILRHMELDYDETRKALLSMADALICLEMLDPSLRIPSFEMLRVREGDSLLGGVYTIGALTGEGGMSRVYQAVQKRTGKRLAIKELKPGTYSEALIRQECDTLSRIHHRAVPQVYDGFSENDTFYIVMDYIEGVPLDQYPEGRSLTEEERRCILRELCNALSYLHSDAVGLVLADLSPDNILIDGEGMPHLIDFGISGRMGERQTIPAATPGYSAPEIFAEKTLDKRADIYSFGQILRFLYTGLSPFEREEESVYSLIQDAGIAEIAERCVSRSPLDRYGSIDEIRSILFPGEVPAVSREETGKKHRLWAVIGIAAVLSLLGIAGYSELSKDRSSALQETAASHHESLSMEEAGAEDHILIWQDEALETAVRRTLHIEASEIRLSDLWDETSLDLSGFGITNIETLSELRNLQYLTLDDNEIMDLTPLSSLTSLRVLSVSGNQISDLDALAELTELAALDAGFNRIDKTAPLQDLKKLQELRLGDNPISADQLAVLDSLTDLQVLDLCGLGLTDCSFLKSHTAMKALYLSDNQLEEISALSALQALEKLYLGDNRISSLEGLETLTALQELDLQNNPVQDLSALSGLTDLVWLDVMNCGLQDLSAISGLSMLAYIDAGHNPVGSLNAFSGLTRLVYLGLDHAGIEGGLDGLKGLTALRTLSLKDNRITDISALAGLRSLQYLYLTGNEIEDYSPIANLHLLEEERDP